MSLLEFGQWVESAVRWVLFVVIAVGIMVILALWVIDREHRKRRAEQAGIDAMWKCVGERERQRGHAGYLGPQNPEPPSGNQIPKMGAKTKHDQLANLSRFCYPPFVTPGLTDKEDWWV